MAKQSISADIPKGVLISHVGPVPGTNVQRIPLECIEANPWQPRTTEDAAHIENLAASILGQGLLQIPTARPHPDLAGRYQVAFGHSRLAAFRWLNSHGHMGFREFPVSIRELTDRQMAEQAAHENIERKDLSAIEVGQAIGRLMADFNLTQAEAGAVYGYTSQSSVSNLMRLLDLPGEVRQLVHAGQLPERIARALVPLARFNAPAVVKLVEDLTKAVDASADESTSGLSSHQNIETRAANAIDDFYQKRGKDLRYNAIWDQAWPKRPLAVPADIDVKDGPETVPACNGCPMRATGRYGNMYCMNPLCYKTKGLMKAREEMKVASKTLGIAMVAPGEKFTVIYKGNSSYAGTSQEMEAILASRHESLRLVPITTADYERYGRKEKLGSEHAMLVTIDEVALKTVVKGFSTTAELKTKRASQPSATAHDWEAERALRVERQNRQRMIQRAAAPIFARAMPDSAAVLAAILHATDSTGWLDGYNCDQRLVKRFASATSSEQKTIVAGVLLWSWVEDFRNRGTKTPEAYVGYINSLQADFGVRLPPTWAGAALNGPLPEEASCDWMPTQEERDSDDDDDDDGDDEEADEDDIDEGESEDEVVPA